MSRPPGPARRALLRAIQSGVTGTYEAIAAAAGVDPEKARATLKEIRRKGDTRALCKQRMAGRPGASRVVHAAAEPAFDALGFVRQAWR